MTRGDGISRRDFVAAAVAIGGSAALSACLQRESRASDTTPDDLPFPQGGDPADLPRGQHFWNEYLVHDAHGNTVLPQHQLILGLSYVGSRPPTEAERSQVESAMTSLERAFQYGTGGEPGAAINRGLLTMLGYAPRYFERLGAPVDLATPREVLQAVGEDPSKADEFDAVLVLNSDFGSVVMAAEQAVRGKREALNGVEMRGSFEGVFEVAERRTGVTGKGLPAEKLESEEIPEAAPLSMGFRSGFRDNQATQDRVTIETGPFAGGTTLQSSRLHIDVDRWYDQDLEARVGEMFCPARDAEEVGPAGQGLAADSGISRDDVADIPEDAQRYDRIGHAQKTASARTDEGFEPKILRRTEGVATDVAEGAGFNFNSVQRTIEDFVDVRRAMNADEYDVEVPRDNHGIIDYFATKGRGTFVVPTRDERALPVP